MNEFSNQIMKKTRKAFDAKGHHIHQCLAYVINLAIQALIKTHMKSKHCNPVSPKDHMPSHTIHQCPSYYWKLNYCGLLIKTTWDVEQQRSLGLGDLSSHVEGENAVQDTLCLFGILKAIHYINSTDGLSMFDYVQDHPSCLNKPQLKTMTLKTSLKSFMPLKTLILNLMTIWNKAAHLMVQGVTWGLHNKVFKKTSALDSQITHAGKKYAMFHYFWVMNGLFPTTPKPNIDLCSDTCWASPEAKLNGTMAELYQCVLKSLHKLMKTYSQFRPLFCAAISSERLNILHSLKDYTGLIFSSLKLDLTVFTAGPAEKKENEQYLLHFQSNMQTLTSSEGFALWENKGTPKG
ncbi:hypothetical protein EDD22DRAFT_848876 [Suillus occidentalis]|nr:hypothetical protein EDD22DRAFT_848876 [Suillus occidentalis]